MKIEYSMLIIGTFEMELCNTCLTKEGSSELLEISLANKTGNQAKTNNSF